MMMRIWVWWSVEYDIWYNMCVMMCATMDLIKALDHTTTMEAPKSTVSPVLLFTLVLHNWSKRCTIIIILAARLQQSCGGGGLCVVMTKGLFLYYPSSKVAAELWRWWFVCCDDKGLYWHFMDDCIGWLDDWMIVLTFHGWLYWMIGWLDDCIDISWMKCHK